MVIPTTRMLFLNIQPALTMFKTLKQNRAYKIRLRFPLIFRFGRAPSISLPKSCLEWSLISEFLDPAQDTLFPKDPVVSLIGNLQLRERRVLKVKMSSKNLLFAEPFIFKSLCLLIEDVIVWDHYNKFSSRRVRTDCPKSVLPDNDQNIRFVSRISPDFFRILQVQ